MAIQKVYVDPSALENIKGEAGEEITLPISYTTSDEKNETTGISFDLLYESSILNFQSFEVVNSLKGMMWSDSAANNPADHSSNADSDISTDKKITFN